MSFLMEQDQTPKFAGQILQDRTDSGLEKKNWDFFSIFKNVKNPVSGKENVRILKMCQTSGPDIMSGRALISSNVWPFLFCQGLIGFVVNTA